MNALELDGFVVAIEGKTVEHDISSAYMNKCGSLTSYWTYDTILQVRW
jgi:hypothetical protein